ncbi:hypothetical protein LTR36_004446 [Oleoguttula mirabilis]|uniref:Uncharacterized protein n=1 Tax=Oleoguttula mirabilis TaxID=1507867 RepID=A0AAV9JH01_9PEZI|nr:hypothetical protein LTR36_004446 [Oleoguttula mirabilis]
MAFSDLGSAIDDSFSPTFFPPAPAGPDDQSQYNGARSGHWTVTSSIGSAIDDRCPTVWGANAGQKSVEQPGAYVKPIDGSLLRKLAKASLENNVAAAEVKHHDDSVAELKPNARQQKPTADTGIVKEKPEATPKGFYIPRANDVRGIKITGKGGKDEVVRRPRVQVETETKEVIAAPKKARAPSPRPSVASEKAPSVVSQASPSKPRMVRIRGKDGREAFIELPDLPKPSPRAPSAAAEKYTPKEVKATPKKPAKQAEIEKTQQERYEEDITAAAKMAAKVLMSGALPSAQKQQRTQQVAKQDSPARQSPAQDVPKQKTPAGSEKSSTKDSGVGFGGLFETAATVASGRSSKAASVKSLQAAVRSINKNSSAVKEPSHHSFQQATSSIHSRAPSVVPSKPSLHTPVHSFHGAVGFEEVAPSAWAGSVASQRHSPMEAQERGRSRQSVKPGDGHSPTVFAGRGWISPHPLSRSSSAVRSPPQSHISLPEEDFVGGTTMTYQDWKTMQQIETAQRRNFSRTESVASNRVKAVAASIAKSGGSRASARASLVGSSSYHKATVESEHGSQHHSAKSASKHSSQHTIRRSQPQGGSSAANGWDPLPQLDGASEEGYTPSQEAAVAYKQQLQDIIAQYPPQMGYSGQPAPGEESPSHEVRLDMPWDRVGGSSSSVRRPSMDSPQQSVATNTPPSAANYSNAQAYSSSEIHQRVYPRKGRSPPMAAPIPMRVYDTTDIEQSAGSYQEASLVPSGYNSAASAGFGRIDEAERGYGGHW